MSRLDECSGMDPTVVGVVSMSRLGERSGYAGTALTERCCECFDTAPRVEEQSTPVHSQVMARTVNTAVHSAGWAD